MSYTNDLHETLLGKNGPSFCRCWRSNFDARSNSSASDHLFAFDTESESKVTFELKPGKDLDANGLTAEHLIRAQPLLPVIFSKFF